MLAFIPSTAPAYSPPRHASFATFSPSYGATLSPYTCGIDERMLYQAHLQHQASIARRRHALLQAEEIQRRQRVRDTEALCWAALQHKQEVAAARLAEAKRIRRQSERAEVIRRQHEQERLERMHQQAALRNLRARRSYLVDALRRAYEEPLGDMPMETHEPSSYTLDDLYDIQCPASPDATHSTAVPPAISSKQLDHTIELPPLTNFLKDDQKMEDPTISDTAESQPTHSAPSSPCASSPATYPVVQQQTPTHSPPSPANTTPASPARPKISPKAANTLLSIYRAHRARRTALASLASIRTALDTLSTSFTFPSHLDFVPPASAGDDDTTSDTGSVASSSSSNSVLAYTPVNKPVHAHEQALVALLAQLDAVPSRGDPRVRVERKRLVRMVERALAEVDEKVDERRKEHDGLASVPASDSGSEIEPLDPEDVDMALDVGGSTEPSTLLTEVDNTFVREEEKHRPEA